MISIDPRNNSERDNYKLLTGTVIPRPVAFVTTVGRDGTVNGAPFSYFNIVSSTPPMISLALQRKNGIMKDTARNIKEKKEFVVHIVDEQNVEQVNITAASLPPDVSEIEKTNFQLIDSEIVTVPAIREAKVRMECVLAHQLELGENGEVGVDFVIGKVVTFHIDEDIYEDGKINHHRLAAISRLAGSNYAKIGATFSLKRPK